MTQDASQLNPSCTFVGKICLVSVNRLLGSGSGQRKLQNGSEATARKGVDLCLRNSRIALLRADASLVAHSMLGILVVIPLGEILMQVIKASRRWMAFITVSIILAIGAFYELIEWWVSVWQPQSSAINS